MLDFIVKINGLFEDEDKIYIYALNSLVIHIHLLTDHEEIKLALYSDIAVRHDSAWFADFRRKIFKKD